MDVAESSVEQAGLQYLRALGWRIQPAKTGTRTGLEVWVRIQGRVRRERRHRFGGSMWSALGDTCETLGAVDRDDLAWGGSGRPLLALASACVRERARGGLKAASRLSLDTQPEPQAGISGGCGAA